MHSIFHCDIYLIESACARCKIWICMGMCARMCDFFALRMFRAWKMMRVCSGTFSFCINVRILRVETCEIPRFRHAYKSYSSFCGYNTTQKEKWWYFRKNFLFYEEYFFVSFL